jgi:uncharacterized protein
MQIEFDAVKDRSNRKKHGMSLADAAALDWNAMLVQLDDRNAYGEERWIGIAPYGHRLHTIIFTLRGVVLETARIISLRLATNAEIKRYETHISQT